MQIEDFISERSGGQNVQSYSYFELDDFFRFFGLITNARLCNFFLWTQFTPNPGPVNMIFLPMKNLFGVLEKYKSKLHLLTFWTQILAEFPFFVLHRLS